MISIKTITTYSRTDISEPILETLLDDELINQELKRDPQNYRDCLLLYYLYSISKIVIGRGSSADHYIRRYDIKDYSTRYLLQLELDPEFESNKFIINNHDKLHALKLKEEDLAHALSCLEKAAKNRELDDEGIAYLSGYYHSTMDGYEGCIKSCKLFLMSNWTDHADVAAKFAIKENADNWEGHFLLGQTYEARGLINEAYKAYSMAKILKGPEKECLLAIAKCQVLLGDLAKAKRNYELALSLEPSDPLVLYLLGALNIQTNEIQQSMELYKKLKSINPKIADELFKLIYS